MNGINGKRIAAALLLAALLPAAGCAGQAGPSGAQQGSGQQQEENMEQQNPIATIEMESGGVIRVELYPDVAENTVRNFIALANDGFYDGLTFHRVIAGFMIQGGDPAGDGTGGPGYRSVQ